MLSDGERRKRLSILCKRLRGDESLRSFTKVHSKELQGISHASWSSWESEKSGLSADSLDRLAHYIGCSHQALFAYLDGYKSVEELLQPDSSTNDLKEEFTLSASAAVSWVQSLSLSDKYLIAFEAFESFNNQLNQLVEEKAQKLAEQKTNEIIKDEFKQFVKDKAEDLDEEVVREIAGDRAKLLVNLLSGESYPRKEDIEEVAQKLNLSVEELEGLCDRLWRVS